MLENIPPEVRQAAVGAAGLLPTALLARLLWHRRLVQMGQRRFWSRDLLWEIPTAGLCAVIGGGLAGYLGLETMASHAVVGVVGWLGPRGVEAVLMQVAARWAGRNGKGGSR